MVPAKSSSKEGLSTDADSVGSSIYKIKYEQEVIISFNNKKGNIFK